MNDHTFSTPMMNQYIQIKKKYADCLLFFRLGDFYELFLDDAIIGSRILNITLTARPRGKDGNIPMAGVPYHAADSYISKLVNAGHKVAICEQVSLPDKYGIVEREVVRVVTPGTVLDEMSLDQKENNYIVTFLVEKNTVAFAAGDLSTGTIYTTEIETDMITQTLTNEFSRFHASECIFDEKRYADGEFLKQVKTLSDVNIYVFHQWEQYTKQAHSFVKKFFGMPTLTAFGIEDKKLSTKLVSVILGYMQETQKHTLSHITSISYYQSDDHVILDKSTMYNLELFESARERTTKTSLASVLDHTVTPMGSRMLRQWMRKPLRSKEEIEKRFDAVEELFQRPSRRETIREKLTKVFDIERLLSRLSVGIGTPPDVVRLAQSLMAALEIIKDLKKFEASLFHPFSQTEIRSLQKIVTTITAQLEENAPVDAHKQGVIKAGINDELDMYRSRITSDKSWVVTFEKQERERTQIQSLKVKYNHVFGYYIEISKAHLDSVPRDYLRKQTLVNAERFITSELKEYEEKIVFAQEKISELEFQLFMELVTSVLLHASIIKQCAEVIGMVDTLLSFAHHADRFNYVRPAITNDGSLIIKEGRHPVIEHLLEDEVFVPNDTILNTKEEQLIIITGPNMAGKSVYIRQIALITLLCHMGSFVPAKEATISIVDRIFVRSGASDAIARGLSTFMVEMVEAAHILRQATDESLIIMDEIGRGTSTYDGISIAWAIAEYLVTQKFSAAKTLFATHYHELQSLEEHFPKKIKNYYVAVDDTKEMPKFLHKVIRGRADQSYGIAVAQLAGIPKVVIEKAKEKLEELHMKHDESLPKSTLLETVDINSLTPLEAFELVKKMKNDIR